MINTFNEILKDTRVEGFEEVPDSLSPIVVQHMVPIHAFETCA